MIWFFLITGTLLLLIVWWRSRRASSAGEASTFPRRTVPRKAAIPSAAAGRAYSGSATPSPYRAVAIVPGESACCSAEEVAGKRYLVKDGPRLPMLNCSKAVCRCTYQHFQDRRSGSEDRRDGVSLGAQIYEHAVGEDRRKSWGRRESDRLFA